MRQIQAAEEGQLTASTILADLQMCAEDSARYSGMDCFYGFAAKERKDHKDKNGSKNATSLGALRSLAARLAALG